MSRHLFLALVLVVMAIEAVVLMAQATVTKQLRSQTFWYVEHLKTRRGYTLSFNHHKSSGSCSMLLWSSTDGKSLDVQQVVDVRFCQVLQLPLDQALERVKESSK